MLLDFVEACRGTNVQIGRHNIMSKRSDSSALNFSIWCLVLCRPCMLNYKVLMGSSALPPLWSHPIWWWSKLRTFHNHEADLVILLSKLRELQILDDDASPGNVLNSYLASMFYTCFHGVGSFPLFLVISQVVLVYMYNYTINFNHPWNEFSAEHFLGFRNHQACIRIRMQM